MIWHSVSHNEILEKFNVDSQKGLQLNEAEESLKKYGKNIIINEKDRSIFKYFLKQLKSKTIICLFIVAIFSFAISLFYGDPEFYTPLLILAIIIVNSFVSSYQLYNCEKTLDSVKKHSNPTARVLREGVVQTIDSELLVPGDIIILEQGDYICADARIIECNEFRCNENNLSGEDIPVEKDSDSILEDITPVSERNNMVFLGTNVVHGSAKAIVVATALNTELGHTQSILLEAGNTTKIPLQNKLKNISNIVNSIILIGCVLVFVIGMLQNFDYKPFANMTLKMLLNAIALAVAAIPESLPAIATTVVAIGIQRILYDNIIIKEASALETLGKTTIICCDKTGTLTRNKMQLSCIFDGNKMIDVENEPLDENSLALLKLATACSTLKNDSTEFAIENACLTYASVSKNDIDALYPRFCEIPFDAQRKTMTTINMVDSTPIAIVKGAPELLLQKCVNCDLEKLLKINEVMAQQALRIVCIAIKVLDSVPANPHPDDIEANLKFVGLLGLSDPPRDDAFYNISSCKRAGIRTVMITGDNLDTANSIAKKIGIIDTDELSITGEELSAMTDEELYENIDKYSVFARISPADKCRIVKAWQSKNEIVTITGDDISDADALALADTGCAMSKFGTDVAKGNADVIILNNHFESLVCAIKESRGLINNIKKTLHYLLSCNFAEIFVVLFGMIFFGSMPITAAQILWINLLTDCAPAFALSLESADDFVMNKKNKALFSKIFDAKSTVNLLTMTFSMGIITLISYSIGNSFGASVAMTMAFLTLGLLQIFNSYNYKRNTSIFGKFIFKNSFMNAISILSIFILIFLSFTPAGFIFGMSILSFWQFVIALALALLIIPISELVKFLVNKYL